METIDDIVFDMNIMLYAKEFDKNKFQVLLNEIRQKYHPRIGMLDLVYYNKVRKKELWDQKINAVRNGEFEIAASYRRKEILGQDLIKFKKRFKIKRSIFKYEEDYLVYLHVGNAMNDRMVKIYFQQ
jgi:hypothetical protein